MVYMYTLMKNIGRNFTNKSIIIFCSVDNASDNVSMLAMYHNLSNEYFFGPIKY